MQLHINAGIRVIDIYLAVTDNLEPILHPDICNHYDYVYAFMRCVL